MIEKDHSKISIRRQCELLSVNRNRLNPRVEAITETDRDIMRALDELHLRRPFYGQRMLLVELRKLGWKIGRKRIRRLMKIMGIAAIAAKPPLSAPAPFSRQGWSLRSLAPIRVASSPAKDGRMNSKLPP